MLSAAHWTQSDCVIAQRTNQRRCDSIRNQDLILDYYFLQSRVLFVNTEINCITKPVHLATVVMTHMVCWLVIYSVLYPVAAHLKNENRAAHFTGLLLHHGHIWIDERQRGSHTRTQPKATLFTLRSFYHVYSGSVFMWKNPLSPGSSDMSFSCCALHWAWSMSNLILYAKL